MQHYLHFNGLVEQVGADVARFDSGEGKISAETAAALELDEGATLNDALVRVKNMAASGGIPTAEFVAVSKATAEAYGLEGDVNVDMVLQVITEAINEATSKSYSKEETLSPSTKTALGLSEDAVPDDAFNALASSGSIENLAVIKIDRSCTWAAPAAKKQLFKVFAIGGGGGGGASGKNTSYSGGGGGGGYVTIETVALPIGSEIEIVIGAGGSGGTSTSGMGVAGGASSFGDIVIAEGGKGGAIGGSSATASCGGNGGSGGGGAQSASGSGAHGGNGSTYG